MKTCMLCQVLPDELEKIMEDKDFVIIDVRTPGEYNQYRIKGSVLIPMNEIPSKIDYFKEITKEKKVLLYCRSGNRSEYVARFLIEQGVEKIYNLQYGIIYVPKEFVEFG